MNINNNKMKDLLVTLALVFVTTIVSAQVLEVSDDEMKPIVYRDAHSGVAYNGSTGLVTIPTPDFQKEQTFGAGFKGGTFKQDVIMNGAKSEMDKDEQVSSLRYNIKPDLEFSAVHVDYRRSTTPKIPVLNYREDMTGFGLKYSTHSGDKDMCMGFTFTPMTAEELNLADIEQIENLRNVYLTVAETVSKKVTGYMNLTSAFTKKQKIKFSNGTVQKIDRKDILIGSVGLEYRIQQAASFFCEAKFGNYRDIFQKDSVRHRINAGIRFGSEKIKAEIIGMDLSDDNPTLTLGGNVAF